MDLSVSAFHLLVAGSRSFPGVTLHEDFHQKSLPVRGFLHICIAACKAFCSFSSEVCRPHHPAPLLCCFWPAWATLTASGLLAFVQCIDHGCSGTAELLCSVLFGLLPLAIRGTCGSYGQLLEKGFCRGALGPWWRSYFLYFTVISFLEFAGISGWVGSWVLERGWCWGAMKCLSTVLHITWRLCGGGQEWETYFSLI